MAIIRLLRAWRDPQPHTPQLSRWLKYLVILQMFAALLTIALVALAVKTNAVQEGWGLIVGFGAGWIALVRFYVWKYVD